MFAFIWRGENGAGVGLDVNGDNQILDIISDPHQPGDVIETTVPYCFEFGENEWINPAYDAANDVHKHWVDYQDDAINDVSLRIPCPEDECFP